MSDNQVNLIVKILLDEEDNLSDGFQYYTPGGYKIIYLGEIAKLILTKLKQQQEEKTEIEQKKQDEKNKIEGQQVMDGKIPFDCSGCYRPYYACRCSTKN